MTLPRAAEWMPQSPTSHQIETLRAISEVERRGYTYEQSDCSTTVWRALLAMRPDLPLELRRWVDVRVDLVSGYTGVPYVGMPYTTGVAGGIATLGLGTWITPSEARFGDLGQLWSASDSEVDPTGRYGARLRRGHAFVVLGWGVDPKKSRPCMWLWSSHPPGQTSVDGPGIDWYLYPHTHDIEGHRYRRCMWIARMG